MWPYQPQGFGHLSVFWFGVIMLCQKRHWPKSGSSERGAASCDWLSLPPQPVRTCNLYHPSALQSLETSPSLFPPVCRGWPSECNQGQSAMPRTPRPEMLWSVPTVDLGSVPRLQDLQLTLYFDITNLRAPWSQLTRYDAGRRSVDKCLEIFCLSPNLVVYQCGFT